MFCNKILKGIYNNAYTFYITRPPQEMQQEQNNIKDSTAIMGTTISATTTTTPGSLENIPQTSG
jgi:hypothetical protein